MAVIHFAKFASKSMISVTKKSALSSSSTNSRRPSKVTESSSTVLESNPSSINFANCATRSTKASNPSSKRCFD